MSPYTREKELLLYSSLNFNTPFLILALSRKIENILYNIVTNPAIDIMLNVFSMNLSLFFTHSRSNVIASTFRN